MDDVSSATPVPDRRLERIRELSLMIVVIVLIRKDKQLFVVRTDPKRKHGESAHILRVISHGPQPDAGGRWLEKSALAPGQGI
jgi:hypothetical protein